MTSAMAAEEDDGSWILAVEAALLESCSLEDLRLVCRGHTIPNSMRPQIWHRFLGLISNRNSFETFNEIFDLPNQTVLRNDCRILVESLDNEEEDKVLILSDLESLLTHYCKSHSINYESNNGLLDVITPLVSLNFSKNEIYGYFNAINESFIPRQSSFNGVAMHLFRLLLLYHDPELCSFLDSHKIAPNLYTQKWFFSLFAAPCNIPAVLTLWDYYFIHSDPYLIFFLSLVLIINAKEEIMSLKGEKEKVLEMIAELPQQMEAADIHDFSSLAVLYSAQTPFSYKRSYHQVLFGEEVAEEEVSASLALSQALCLPVSVEELLVSCQLLNRQATNADSDSKKGLRFFLVDCRPAEQYNAGHLPTAFHLDSNLMLTEPQAFNVAVQALLSSQKQSIAAQSAAGGEHLVFFGSGREIEDQYVHMVVAFFLQRHVQFVGLVQGGFQAVHQALVDAQSENGATWVEPIGLVDHSPALCLVCTCGKPNDSNVARANENAEPTTPAPAKSSAFFERMRSKSATVKEKLLDYIVNPNVATTPQTNQSTPSAVKSAKGSANSGVKPKTTPKNKLYRNLAPVFTIDDDQESDNSASLEGAAEREADAPHQEMVAISSWLNKPDVISSFRCHEVKESGHAFPSYLLVTSSHVYALREIQDRPGFARITVNRKLTAIMKITSKKRHPEFITFKYGTMQGEETIITDMDRFVIPQAGDAVKLVKQQLFNCSVMN